MINGAFLEPGEKTIVLTPANASASKVQCAVAFVEVIYI